MQSDNIANPNFSKPKWDTTTKVVIAVFLMVLMGLAVYFFRIVFIPLIVGGIVAYLFQPVVRKIRQFTRLPHKVATALLYVSLLAIIVLLGIALSPLLAAQAQGLVKEITTFIRTIEEQGGGEITALGITLNTRSILDEVRIGIEDLILPTAAQSIVLLPHAAETALLLIFTLLISFYMTRDAEQIITWIQHLIPPQYHTDVDALLAEIDEIWSAFFRGQVILSLVVTFIVTGICMLLGLPQPFLLGILAGVLEFLPSVGHAIWLIIALIIALVTGSTWLPVDNHILFALLVVGAHIVFTQFDLNYLIPRIIGEHVHLHPMVVIVGIILGATVGGVLGIALAAPTIATLRIFGRYIYALLFDIDPYPRITTKDNAETQPHPDESTVEAIPVARSRKRKAS